MKRYHRLVKKSSCLVVKKEWRGTSAECRMFKSQSRESHRAVEVEQGFNPFERSITVAALLCTSLSDYGGTSALRCTVLGNLQAALSGHSVWPLRDLSAFPVTVSCTKILVFDTFSKAPTVNSAIKQIGT